MISPSGKQVLEKILTEGFKLSKSSVHMIMREQKIGTRNKKRAKKNVSKSKTCNRKGSWEDKK